MKNKNYTLFWLVILGALLTVPIAFLIMNKLMEESNFLKAFLITLVFIILTSAIVLIYKNTFGVSIDEITQSNKLTALNKKLYWLVSYKKKHNLTSNVMKRLQYNIDKVIQQIENFERRKEVFLGLLDEEQLEKGNAVGELAQTVEDALDFYVDKVIDRILIFDDKVQENIVYQNLEYIEKYVNKNDNVLTDFEKLIAEISSMGDVKEEADMSRLTDIIQAMESLRTQKKGDMENLKEKYK